MAVPGTASRLGRRSSRFSSRKPTRSSRPSMPVTTQRARRGTGGSALPSRVPRADRRGGRTPSSMTDILQRLCDKMTRRHPHVFGDTRVARRPRPSWPSGRLSSSAKPPDRREPLGDRRRAPRAARADSGPAYAKQSGPGEVRLAGCGVRVDEGPGGSRRRQGTRWPRATSARPRGAWAICSFRSSTWRGSRRSTPRPPCRALSRSSGGGSRTWKRRWRRAG